MPMRLNKQQMNILMVQQPLLKCLKGLIHRQRYRKFVLK